MTYLPGLLGEIAEIAGEDAAIAVARAVGGTRQYIPGKAGAGHWLVRAVGRQKADLICAHFAHVDEEERPSGQHYVIPLGPAGSTRAVRRSLAKVLANGTSAREAARLAGVHERTAWRMKAKLQNPDNSDQGELF